MYDQTIKNLLTENYEKYYRIIFTYLRNEHDSLDALQEGAAKAIINAEKLKNEKYADTYIVRIMINEALRILREGKRETMDIELASQIPVEDSYTDFDLENALMNLEDTEREIITLKYFQGLQLSEIGELLSLNINTVKSRMYRALRKMQIYMEG